MKFTSANAREPYYKRIHSLLKKYHQSTILKELLQNADDAGATEFKIMYDTNSYSTDQLIPVYNNKKDNGEKDMKKENLEKMQGPSLIVYNNSSFKEKDWQGIMSLGSGSKENDFKSVGKFGLGVNSVYHVSDYLTIVSDRTLFIQDPLQKISEDGLLVNYIEESLDQEYPGSTQPFKHFGCDMVQPFNGTIIRLPIRTEGGLIKIHPINDYDEIFREFTMQLKELLIFLKNISVVEVYMDNVMKFKVSISNNDEICGERTLVHDYVSEIANSMETCNFADFIEIIKSKSEKDLPLCTFKMNLEYFTTVNGSVELSGTSSYLITQGLVKEGLEDFDIRRFTTKLIPWGGVAVPIGLSDEERMDFKGIPFTFLPIGTLRFDNPFHINGFFVLSDARTDIPFSSTMLESSEEYFDSLWNKFIITHIIPVLYSSNIEHMTKKDMEPNQIYSFFPRSKYTNGTDKLLSSEILKRLVRCKTFQSVHTLNYYTLADCHCITDQDQNISDVLHKRGYAVVKIPDKLLDYLEDQNLIVNFVTPQFVCDVLKVQQLEKFNFSILDYLMDHTLISGGHIHNVKIFPMADGSVGSMTWRTDDVDKCLYPIYYPDSNQFNLLKPRFSKLTISESIIDIEKMEDNYFKLLTGKYNVLYLDHTTFIESLKDIFEEMVGENKILHELPFDFNFDIFWIYMISKDVSPIDNLACIPITKDSLQSSQFYISPRHPRMLLDKSLSDPIRRIAFDLGFYILKDNQLSNAISHVDSYSNFLNELTCEMVLDQDSGVKKDIRTYLISNTSSKLGTIRSTDHSIKIFSLPLFSNTKCGFSSIQSQTKCTKWKDISKFSSEEFVIFEDEEKSLSNWPTELLPKGEIILQFILPHIDSYERDDQYSIAKLILKENSIHKRIGNYAWIPNENGTLSNIENVLILTESEERLIQYTPKGKSQLISKQLMDQKLWSAIGVKNYYKDWSGYSLVKDCMNNLPNQKDLDIVNNAIPLIGNFIVSKGLRNQEFLDIPFIPVKKNHPFRLNEPSIEFVSISNCYLNLELCFSVATIGDVDPKVLYHFKQFLPKISVQLVKDHLINLIDMYRDRQTASTFSEDDIKSMNEIMEKIYKEFDINCFNLNQNSFDGIDWIWNGNKFISPTRVFKNGKSVDPYIFELPQYLKKFNNLIAITNIPNEPTYDHYLNIIEEIYEISQGHVLSDEQFSIVISTINALSMMKSPMKTGKLYLPTIKRILVESNKIIFSESDNVHESLKSFSILHRDISLNMAKNVGIRSSMDAIRRGKPIGSDFGQREDIVQRIKNINEEYKIDSFLKEMVQNAEDCGATILEICLDKRSYTVTEEDVESQSKFRDYLEPSIVIYNDKMFTEEDIYNIQCLGASNKRADTSKIGQYGIGFNSVYNFTDVPSIITRNSLYIFDPLKTHFSVEESPGRSYEFNIRDQLKDTFQPLQYPDFGLLLDKDYQHTIIRLPLRNSISRISDLTWNVESIKIEMDKFQKDAENCLLFQRSLKKIIFSVIEDDGTKQSTEIFERIVTDSFDPSTLKEISESFEWSKGPIEKYYFMNIEKNGSNVERWFVGWRIGAHINGNLYKNYQNRQQKTVPLGSIAMCLEKKINGVPFTYLPLPKSTELPVHVNGCFILNSARQDVFNSLPNNINTYNDWMDEKSIWNISIVEEILSPLYLLMLSRDEFKCHFIGPGIDLYYSLFPQTNTTLWDRITKYFYQNAHQYSIFSNLNSISSYSWTDLKSKAFVIKSSYKKELDHCEIIDILLKDSCKILLIPNMVYDKLLADNINLFNQKNVSEFYRVIKNGFLLIDPPKPSLQSKHNILNMVKYLSPYIDKTPFMLLQNGTQSLIFELKSSPEKHYFKETYYNLLPTMRDSLFIHKDICSLDINIYCANTSQNGYVLDLSFPQFFIKYLVPQLHTFTTYDQCFPILTSLKENWHEFSGENIKKLSECNIVPVINIQNQILKFNRVSKYYSTDFLNSNLFQLKYKLPPIFDQFLPKTLLDLNIRVKLTISKIQKEFLALKNQPDEDKFDQLYLYLQKNFLVDEIKEVLHYIQDFEIISCVHVDEIGAVYTQFASLSKSSDSSCQDLCFTILPIRKTYFEVTKPMAIPDDIIVQHLYNLINSSKEWSKESKLKELSNFLNKVMDRILDSTTDVVIKQLPKNAEFPLNLNLVPIKDIIVTSENLRPFFYTFPKDLMRFQNIFNKLGFSKLNSEIILKKLRFFKNKSISQEDIKTVEFLLNLIKGPSPTLPDINGIMRDHSTVYLSPNLFQHQRLLKRIEISQHLHRLHPEIESFGRFSISELVEESINLNESIVLKVDGFINFKEDSIQNSIRENFKNKESKDRIQKWILSLETLNVYQCSLLVSKFTIIATGQDVTNEKYGSEYIYDKCTNTIYINSKYYQPLNFTMYIQKIFQIDIAYLYEGIKYDNDENPMDLYNQGKTNYGKDGDKYDRVTIGDINHAHAYKIESKSDLDAAYYLFRGGFYSKSCFYVQQSLEKLFKAYCFKKGISIKSKYIILWRKVKDIDCSAAETIENYFLKTRYPSRQGHELISSNDIFSHEISEKAINICQNIYNKLGPLI